MGRPIPAIVAGSLLALALLAQAGGAFAKAPAAGPGSIPLQGFEKDVERYRDRLKIPGLSVVILKDQDVLWTRGFGFADLENRVPATPDTLYSIASLTKTIGATLVMQLVERGELDLDEPISRYSGDFKDDSVRIKHLLSHTAAGTPGERFQYDGGNYDYLTAVIEKKAGKPFVQVVVETFFDPLAMTESVPYHAVVKDADKWVATLGKERLDRYERNLARLAKPYGYYGAGEIVRSTYPPEDSISAAAGLISTVRDLARYDIAIDRHVFLRSDTQEKAWTPFVSNKGDPLPYGLGWFVTRWHGLTLVWHYGQWGTGFSAIYLKIPERNVAVIILANSEALAANGGEDITTNVFVCSFLGLWGAAYDCRQKSEAALARWAEQRRSEGRVAVPVPTGTLGSYVGRYQFEALDNRIYSVTREGDRLFFSVPGGSRLELFPESDSKFFLKIRPYVLTFTTMEGQPPQLEIAEGDQTFQSKRLER